MMFLSLLLALIVLWRWQHPIPVHADGWFESWRATVGEFVSNPVALLLLTVLPPVIVTHWLLDSISGQLFGLLWVVLAALLLMYAFGRLDVEAALARYRGALQEADFTAIAQTLGFEAAIDEQGEGRPLAPQDIHRQAQRGYFYAAFEGTFAVLFWFFLLGPGGAVTYRLLQLSCTGKTQSTAMTWLFYVDWLPARLLAASFAVTGDFLRSRHALLQAFSDPRRLAGDLLQGVGVAALGASAEPATTALAFGAQASQECLETQSMLARTRTAWVAAIALWVVFG